MAVIISEEPRSRKDKKTANPIVGSRAARKDYRLGMKQINGLMKAQTQQISDLIKSGQSGSQILAAIESAAARAAIVAASSSNRLASGFVDAVQGDNKRKFESMVESAMGVDSATILDSEATRQTILESTAENVDLIKTIPTEHFDRVSKAVLDNFRGVKFEEGSLTNRLKKIGGISDRRAAFIARDQTSKLVGALNDARQTDSGISEYIWRNAQDERVVGNPGGLYPKGNRKHNNHWKREGKKFKWSEPPPDGHPGQPINCRCRAEPFIDVEKMKQDAIRI